VVTMEESAMLRKGMFGLGLGVLLVLGGGGASVTTANMRAPHDVECEDLDATNPSGGQSSKSTGSPFNEGTGGQNYSESSQYDVACFVGGRP
jgi:hypothetical protein